MTRTNSKVLSAALTLMVLAAVVSASDLRPGEAVLGTIAPDSAQAFNIDCARGDTVKITMKARGAGDHAPDITICDPTGEAVTAARGSRKNKATFTASQTGTYEVRVHAVEGASTRYQMKVKGETRRSHAAAAAEITFGAPAGAEVRFKVKGAARAEMRDSRGRQIDLLQSGARFRSAVLARTDEYRIAAPGASRIKVKVLYPDARDALVVESPGSRYDAPGVQVPAQTGNDANDPAADAGDGVVGPADGEVTDPGSDGSVGNGGTAGGANGGAAAVAQDHAYLIALLSAEEDVDVQKARVEYGPHQDRAAEEVAADLRNRFADPIAQDLADAAQAQAGTQLNPAQQAHLLDLLAAQRRIDRAYARLAELQAQVPGTAMMGNAAFDQGAAQLAAAAAEAEAAVAQAMEQELADRLAGAEAQADAANLDAPAAPAATMESHAGLAAMDAALSGGLMMRARQGNREAREAAALLTAAYGDALAAFPGQDANAAATQATLSQREAELAGLEAQHGDFELAVEPMAAPQANEDYEIVVRALGADAAAMDWEAEGAELDGTDEANGIRLAVQGHVDAHRIVVRAERAGNERVVEIQVDPADGDESDSNDEPQAPALSGQLFSGGAAAADVEITILRDEQIVAQAHSDDQGRFEIDALPAGEYVLVAGEIEMPFSLADALDLGAIDLD